MIAYLWLSDVKICETHRSENKKDAIHCYHFALDSNEKECNPYIYYKCYNTFNFYLIGCKRIIKYYKTYILPKFDTIVASEVD